MSTRGVDVGAMTASQPRGPLRLTTQHILANAGGSAPATWPLGHPRGAPNPMPAARWTGPQQPLQAHTAPDVLKAYRSGGVVLARGGCSPAGDAEESESSYGMRADLLDRIDIELHAGRPVAVSLSTATACAAAGDACGRPCLHVIARNYWPDGTVYYLCQDGSAYGQDIRLYVHEQELSLVKPGLRTARYAADRESVVICVATVQG